MNLKFSTFIFFIFCAIGSGAFAQHKVKRYDAIVKTTQGKRFKGLLENVNESGLTIRFHKQSKFIAPDSIKTIRIKRYNAQNRHLLTGGLLGLAGGLTAYKLENDKGNVGPIILPVVIVSSTLAGSAIFGTINSLTAVERFEDVSEGGNYRTIREKLKSYSLSR